MAYQNNADEQYYYPPVDFHQDYQCLQEAIYEHHQEIMTQQHQEAMRIAFRFHKG